jgi:peptidoglycan/xylan/chitin deacetylase (PgdA/CDA1 family)
METHGGLHMTHRLFRLKSLHFRLRRPGAVVATVSAAAISVAGLSAAPASAARSATIPVTPPTVVSFTFDNQWASQMTAAAALKAHNMAGTFYIISGWIGQPGFMTLANLNTLAANGDEIGGKTINNADLPTKSNAEAQREICQGRNVLLADGFKVTNFAYPFADLNAADETLVKACGFNSGRGVGDVASADVGACAFPDCPYAETIPPADPYNIATPDDAEQTTTLAQMEKTVTNAEAHGGGLLALSFHQICATTTAGCDPVYSWSPTLFNNFLTWLQGQVLLKRAQVKTIAQVIGGAVQPAVIAPAVPAAPVGTNALVNPTLTTADPVTPANPQCWTQNGYGTNTPSFSWSTTGGATSGGQETISMSGLTSGDAKLLTTQDLGQCAPTTVTGDSYQLSVWYKSTVPVFLTVYGRAANDTWSYWTQSPTFPASAGWTQATWLTPAMPSTVTALSYGMTIPSNGTLSTSNYSLVDNGAGVPAAAAIGVQALQNPLLQTADGTGTNPACWMAAGFGTNSPTFTWSPTGGQTGGQETVNMTSWTDGDAKLVTPFDNGNCAPTVTAGGVYTMSVYYESTVPVFLTLYSRNAATGVWGYWTQSQAFPAATGWTLATLTTPAVPSTVNGASFGMTIASVGTLSTSSYSLVRSS